MKKFIMMRGNYSTWEDVFLEKEEKADGNCKHIYF